MPQRNFKVTRGAANRDPMFAPIWYDGSEMVLQLEQPPAPAQFELLPLPPPSSPEAARWQHLLDLAGEVTAVLRGEPDFDGYVLAAVASGLSSIGPTADEIIAAYRRRMAERQDGQKTQD